MMFSAMKCHIYIYSYIIPNLIKIIKTVKFIVLF